MGSKDLNDLDVDNIDWERVLSGDGSREKTPLPAVETDASKLFDATGSGRYQLSEELQPSDVFEPGKADFDFSERLLSLVDSAMASEILPSTDLLDSKGVDVQNSINRALLSSLKAEQDLCSLENFQFRMPNLAPDLGLGKFSNDPSLKGGILDRLLIGAVKKFNAPASQVRRRRVKIAGVDAEVLGDLGPVGPGGKRQSLLRSKELPPGMSFVRNASAVFRLPDSKSMEEDDAEESKK